MSLNDLTAEEREIVRRALVAAAEGPYFPEWEFQTLFGITRPEVSHVIEGWPVVHESRDVVHLAINNALGNLLGYPHGRPELLEREVGHFRAARTGVQKVAQIIERSGT
jgi:hypothetical protein